MFLETVLEEITQNTYNISFLSGKYAKKNSKKRKRRQGTF